MSVIERCDRSLGRLYASGAVVVFLAAAWSAGQVLVAVLFGRSGFVQLGVDSATFLAAAEHFPSDQGTLRGYSGYVAVLALGHLLGSASWFLIVVQNLTLIAAGWCVVDIGRRLGSMAGGLLGALALLVNPLFSQWFRYVLTETLFVSGLVILTWMLLRAAESGHRWRWWALITALVVATLRPNGVLVLVSTLSFLAWVIWRGRRPALQRSAMVLPWLAVVLAGLTLSSAQQIHGSQNSFAAKTVAGEVFWNEPDTALSMPEPDGQVVSNRDVVRYALEHPAAVTRLYGMRLGYELLQIRPRYSDQLNLFAIVTTPLLWSAAIIGAWRMRKSPVVRGLLLITVPQALLICVTWATPEGRFGWWLLGPSMALAGCGAVHVAARALGSSHTRSAKSSRFNSGEAKFPGGDPTHAEQQQTVREP